MFYLYSYFLTLFRLNIFFHSSRFYWKEKFPFVKRIFFHQPFLTFQHNGTLSFFIFNSSCRIQYILYSKIMIKVYKIEKNVVAENMKSLRLCWSAWRIFINTILFLKSKLLYLTCVQEDKQILVISKVLIIIL